MNQYYGNIWCMPNNKCHTILYKYVNSHILTFVLIFEYQCVV